MNDRIVTLHFSKTGQTRLFRWKHNRLEWSSSIPSGVFAEHNWVEIGTEPIIDVRSGSMLDSVIVESARETWCMSGDPVALDTVIFQVLPGEEPSYRQPLPNSDVNRLFHRLWTKAVGAEDYDKSEWIELQWLLADSEIYV